MRSFGVIIGCSRTRDRPILSQNLGKVMPELPEVETAVRALREPLEGHIITAAVFPPDPGRMTNINPAQLAQRIASQRVNAITRRSKYLLFHLDPHKPIGHLKMTAHLYSLHPD